VSRVPLDQVDGGRVVDLVHQIRTDLDGLDWSAFEAVRRRWLAYDMNLLDEQFGQALIDNRGADIHGSPRFIGQHFEHATNVYVMGQRGWPSKYHADEVDRIYVRAFCADLRRNAASRPVVLLFDAYDRAPAGLQSWVSGFLESHCLDVGERPPHLVAVLAGRTLPALRAQLQERFEELVDLVDAFEEWSDELVARFLAQRGFPDARATEIAMLRDRINEGELSLQNVLPLMLVLRSKLTELELP